MSSKPDLHELASRVSDGDRIDWDDVEQSAASDEDRLVIRNLRLLHDVAEVHRTGQGLDDSKEGHETHAGTCGAILSDESLDEAPIRAWGPLEIRRKVGEGGFGEVYRAWDPKLEREVALKLLKKEPSSRESLASAVIRESRLLARVDHPNVVTVHGAETHDGRVGFWTEFVRGRSLEGLLREQGKFGAREAALIGLDLCRALAAVHQAGLVHRDVKGRNVMRQEGGRILLMDFGAGRDLRDDEASKERGISGTPLYIAPEVYDGAEATPRSDIYSLGVLLFRLVTKTYPVQATSLRELRKKHSRRETLLLRDVRSDLPEAFVKVIERAMAWDPQERFATAGEMERALSMALGVEGAPAGVPETRSRSNFGLPIAVAAIVVLALFVAAMLSGLGPFRTSSRAVGEGSARIDAPAGADLSDIAAETDPPTPPPATSYGTAGRDTPGQVDSNLSAPPKRAPRAAASKSSPVLPDPYTVQASLIRRGREGRRERLDQGARLQLGDWLSLEFEASRDVYVYVINEDEQGHAYALFPLPDLELQNPLAGGLRHEIPGHVEGKPSSWEVDTPGGREHLMILASPERLVQFEADMASLARPLTGEVAVLIPDEVKQRLRGIGSLRERPDPSGAFGSIERLFDRAQQLGREKEAVRGAWLRRIELDNPVP